MSENLYTYRAIVTRVVDGDTLDLRVDLGMYIFHRVRVRLKGIDTPEVYGVKKESEEYNAGKLASARAKELVDGKSVIVKTEKDKTGKYGRYIADILFDDDDGVTKSLSEVLIQEGLGNVL